MKYTETFFRFPIRVNKLSIQANEETEGLDVNVDWVSGVACIPFDDILGWYDSFSDDRTVAEVAERGCDITIVETKSMGEFIVNLPREKFEKLLDKFHASLPDEEPSDEKA